ncbi:MAG: NADH-quinone oxidoreductase subunit N [Thermodesulfobacteriota bacterium]
MRWMLVLPEIYFLAAAAVFCGLAMASKVGAGRAYGIALFLSALGVLVSLASAGLEGPFLPVYRVDLFSQVFKILLAIGYFLAVCICSELQGIREDRHPAFYLLLTLCTLGLMLLASGVELLTLYVSLELASYSLYVLVPLRRGRGIQMEAGIKYFLIGAVASALMLLGLACLYGAAGSTYVAHLARLLPEKIDSPLTWVGLLLALSGFFFKLALFPFHGWAPTVYQGAANQVAAYIATATKAAAIAVLVRFMSAGAVANPRFVHILVGLAVATMTLGNLVAIVQKDLKRLLAYSSIAQAGYVLVGILSGSENGYAGAIFYAVAYAAMNFTCFLVLVKVAGDGRDVEIEGLAGLHRRSPLLAMTLMVGLFSLGGIPPTIGFTGKFLVFHAAMLQGHFYLVLIAMANVVVSLYYYARVVRAAFLLEPKDPQPVMDLSLQVKLLAAAMVLVTGAGGLVPGYLYSLALAAAQRLG